MYKIYSLPMLNVAAARLMRRVIVILGILLLPLTAHGEARIKDIVDVEGVRDNMLVGYGLVVGLNGTGDSLGGSPFTEQSLIGMLERLGVNIRDDQVSTENIAAVMVTATLPPFARHGSRLPVTVSSLGDAESLLGGQLLVTPLLGADGEVYAVAQGALSIGGFSAAGDAGTITQGVPTTGRVPDGAIVEREVNFNLDNLQQVRLALRNPDFTTARRIETAINQFAGATIASATDPATVLVRPSTGTVVDLLTDIEQLRVLPDSPARVVINERTGVIVMGENVQISTVAIAQGNLTIRVTETPQVSQPGPFSQTGNTVTVPRTQIDVDTGANNQLGIVGESVSLRDVVEGLNSLGVGPRDMIAILQAIQAAGALQAEIETM